MEQIWLDQLLEPYAQQTNRTVMGFYGQEVNMLINDMQVYVLLKKNSHCDLVKIAPLAQEDVNGFQ